MSIWIFLWIIISICLLGFLAWSLFVIYRQKTAWKGFADKHGLRYESNAMMQIPEVAGEIDSYKISMFSSEHITEDVRGSRKLSAIEINLKSKMPFEGVVANTGMLTLVDSLEYTAELKPDHEKWSKSFIATGDSRNALKKYLTKERLDLLTKVLRLKNSASILIFRNEAMLLRVDMPNPIQSEKYLQKLVDLMIKTANVLELGPGESAILKSEANKADAREISVDIPDADEEEDFVPLELEDDEAATQEEDNQASEEKPETSKS